MAVTHERKRLIRTAWKTRGAAKWDREVHGRGLEPLNIQASISMRTPSPGQPPLPLYDDLEYRLERTTIDGQPMTSIVCDGVVVETWPDQPTLGLSAKPFHLLRETVLK